jgi:hypothetical protein
MPETVIAIKANAEEVAAAGTHLVPLPSTVLLQGAQLAGAAVGRIVASSGDLFNMGSNKVLNGDGTEGSAFQRPLYVAAIPSAPGGWRRSTRATRGCSR